MLATALLVASAEARAQYCTVAEPEFSVPSLDPAILLTETATHYYEGRVPVQHQPTHSSLYVRLLQATTGTLYLRDPQDPGNPGKILTEPVSGSLLGMILEYLPSNIAWAFGGQEDGLAVRWNGAMNEDESIDLGRLSGACGDSVSDIALQIAEHSSAAFQSGHGGDDLLYVATAYSSTCAGHNTDNKVYALDPYDFTNIVWIFNESELLDVDTVSGLAVDRALVDAGGGLEKDAFQDRLFVTTERTYLSTQHSVWAIDVLNGAVEWSVSAGRIPMPPVVRDDRLYVATVAGQLKALDKTDGSELWSIQRFIPFAEGEEFAVGLRPPYDDLIVLVDAFGDVVFARDHGASADWLWTTELDETGTVEASTAPVIDDATGHAYVGADDGRIYQLDLQTGAVEASVPVDPAGEAVTALLRGAPPKSPLIDPPPLRFSLTAAAGDVLVRYCTPFDESPPSPVPMLSPGGLAALVGGLLLAAAAAGRRRRS